MWSTPILTAGRRLSRKYRAPRPAAPPRRRTRGLAVLSPRLSVLSPRSSVLSPQSSAEPLVVFLEQLLEPGGLRLVRGLVPPRGLRIQDLVGHARAAGRNHQAEVLFLLELDEVQVAVEGGADHGPRVLQVDALAHAVATAAPARVHQVHLGAVAADALAQHLGVARRRQRQERLAEGRRKRRLRLRHAPLGTRQLAGVAR